MTREVRELLSQVGLDMSGHVSENSTPKRLNPMVLLTPLPNKLGDLSRPVDTSPQMSAPDDAEMAAASLEEIPTAPSPTAETAGPSNGAPPADAVHLIEEANKALGGLLATKSSIDAHQQKLVWELGMNLCQNDSKTSESIKEAKAICTHSTRKPRPSAPQPSRKLRPPVATPSRKLKPFVPQPSGMQRPGEPPRLTHFNDHMLSPSHAWKNKLSRRRVRVSLTSSLPVN